MIIKRLKIKNFGKIQDRVLELSPGMNVLYGENESGKTTVHTFLKSMLFGLSRLRGRAARHDAYTTYEPWEGTGSYGGILWFESGGRNFRLTRNFHKSAPFQELICEDDGELLDMEQGDLEGILGDVSEAVYDNTVSVAQLKSVTGNDLVRELQNYMASYEGAGDSSVDLGRTMQMLKMSRKGFQVQESRRRQETAKEKEKLAANMEYLKRELNELKERKEQVEQQARSMQIGKNQEDGEAILELRIQRLNKNRKMWKLFWIAGAALLAAGEAAALLLTQSLLLQCVLPVGILFLAAAGFFCDARLLREIRHQEKLRARWLSRQEKLSWNRESLTASCEEKSTAWQNLAAEYQEYDAASYRETPEEVEIQALNLAMDTIEKLSGSINHQLGGRLRQRTSQILGEITGGKYTEVLMDGEFHMSVNTRERVIPLERLSRGTLEQIYFALRMAAGELFCGEEAFPVILDEVFGMYDEERLVSVLKWLYKEQKQVVISTCHKREMELLEREGIPFQRLEL